MDRESLFEEVMLSWDLKDEKEPTNCVECLGKSVPGIEKSLCKYPEVGSSLAMW